MATVLASHRARSSTPGARLRLLVVVCGPGRCTGIDLASGAFVRGAWSSPADAGLAPYRLADAVIAPDDAPPDPACPEAVLLEGPPEAVGRLGRHRVERYLRALEAPPGQPLLGFRGPAIPYWQVAGTHPSMALLRPGRGPQLVVSPAALRPGLAPVRARFQWGGLDHTMPLSDGRLRDGAVASGRSRLSSDAVAAVLGHPIRYLLVALTGPQGGHCYKSVAAVLPPP